MKRLTCEILETDKLLLRPLKESDAKEMFENWASSEKATRYVTWYPYVEVETLRQWLVAQEKLYADNQLYDWGIVLKESNQLIGTIGFVAISEEASIAELGYIIGARWWGNGYVAQAGKALLDFGFKKLHLHRIVAVHDINNPNSGRVMEKLGMI